MVRFARRDLARSCPGRAPGPARCAARGSAPRGPGSRGDTTQPAHVTRFAAVSTGTTKNQRIARSPTHYTGHSRLAAAAFERGGQNGGTESDNDVENRSSEPGVYLRCSVLLWAQWCPGAGYRGNGGLHEDVGPGQADGLLSEQRQLPAPACDQECARGAAEAERRQQRDRRAQSRPGKPANHGRAASGRAESRQREKAAGQIAGRVAGDRDWNAGRPCLFTGHSFLFNNTGPQIFALLRGNRERSNGQAEIRTHQAALQCGDHWSRGPWQDDVDGGADEGVGGQGLDVELRAL